MKIIIDQRTFLRALRQASSFSEKRNTIPILGCGMFRIDDGVGYLHSTNMEQSAAVTIPNLTVIDEGDPITLPIAQIISVVRKLPAGAEVTLEVKDLVLKLSCGRFFTKIVTLDACDFPAITTQDMPCTIKIPSKVLLRHIKTVEFAISTEETRYYLNGIFLTTYQGDLAMVATDGHRLAVSKILSDVTVYGDLGKGVIIPRGFVSRLSSILDRDGEVALGVSENRVSITFPDLTVSSKVIDGTFPEFSRVIPRGNDRELIVNCEQLSSIVNRVSAISEQRSRPVKFSITPDQMVIECVGEDGNHAEDVLDVPGTDFNLEIGFQAKYVLDVINASSGRDIQWMFGDSSSPSVICPIDNSSNDLFVLMPMRV